MNIEYGVPSRHLRSVSAKAAYSKSARKKLVESRAKLDGMKTAIKRAIASGQLKPSEKLACAQRATEVQLAVAETRLKTLQKSSAQEWEQLKVELEDAWEDLSHSINKLVAQIKDQSG